jgi:hypothetical protein
LMGVDKKTELVFYWEARHLTCHDVASW